MIEIGKKSTKYRRNPIRSLVVIAALTHGGSISDDVFARVHFKRVNRT